ncbi:Rieske 2Fe-2S domain-containing protein [Rubrobacter marinus]|uniref:Rieske 2Fe-2S domain-containing protein n=1 Tax=Rubrobacter marinus TaxID=2653852 RepID=A0A6G8Q0J4_9ACTN|nr:Rieske (2Fe-2S) protein [Rubrobacter marinus]QIN80009.1 Rieske 2Fe-2S domain-containing protein [Rubrobacter marinus]
MKVSEGETGREAVELFAGKAHEYGEGSRKVVRDGETEIGVFRVDETFYAYDNYCLHQGGPVCEGVIIGKVEAVLDEDGGVIEERFSYSENHIVCPWHGWEYNVVTGECATDRRMRLKRYEVVLRGGEVYVLC